MCEVELLRPGIGAFLSGVSPGPDQVFDRSVIIAPAHGRFCDMAEIELLQFTGLTDKNGREVYEGDIIKTSFGWPCVVEYKSASFMWAGLHLGYDEEEPYEETDSAWGEVIGNLYENPEMLISKATP